MSLLARVERASHRAEGYRWYALGITTFCQAAVCSLSSGIGPIAPFLQAEFQITRAEIGLTLTVIALSGALVALLGGRAADHVGERRVLIVSGLLVGLAGLSTLAVGSFWGLLAVCFAIGLGFGIQNPAGSAAIMRWFPTRQRGRAMGIRQTGVPLGGILAASVWPFIALAVGWRWAFVIGGLLTLAGASLIFVGYFDPVRTSGSAVAKPLPMRTLLRDAQIWWLAVIYNGQIVAQYAVTAYFVLFLYEVLGLPVVVAAGLRALVNLAAIAARIGWGLLSDIHFLGRRRAVLLLIVGLTLGGALAAAGLPAGAPWPVAAGLAILFGVSAFAWTGIVGTLVIEHVGRESAGTAIALMAVLGAPSTVLSAPAFGLVADVTGSYRVAWLAVAAFALLSLVAWRNVTETTRNTG